MGICMQAVRHRLTVAFKAVTPGTKALQLIVEGAYQNCRIVRTRLDRSRRFLPSTVQRRPQPVEPRAPAAARYRRVKRLERPLARVHVA